MAISNCVYCGEKITTPSREHVIQNALGGLYESTDICCPGCNNYVSREIDTPFTTIFNPIIGGIGNIPKTHNKNSTPLYTGTVEYNGEQYKANIKAGKIVGCPDLSKKLHTNAAKLPLKIVGYDFNIENDYFRTGIAKIAFNYALAQGVDFNAIKDGLKVEKNDDGTLKNIKYEYPIVPFYPVNSLDDYLELHTAPDLYHNMVLFSQHSNLWCYVDLFNTFQYYVLLSQKLPNETKIYDSYMQTLNKNNVEVPDIEIYGPKDAMIYAQQYGVEPTMDVNELKARIAKALENRTYKQSTQRVIEKRFATLSPLDLIYGTYNHPKKPPIQYSTMFYFDEDESLILPRFRTLTPVNKMDIIPYPEAISDVLSHDKNALQEYTTHKFMRLNYLICTKTK